MSKPIHILFLCVANSARSQIAEGLAKSIFGDQAIIESAGSEPSGIIQPWAIEVLKENDIDISKNWSKSVEQLSLDFLNSLDYVITLCAEEICPVLPSKAKHLHWPIPDPANAPECQKKESFQKARNLIHERLTVFQNEFVKNLRDK